MYRYEVQFLGRTENDYDRHIGAVNGAKPSGRIAFKSYYFAGVKGLIVLVENRRDCDAVVNAVPRSDLIGAWEIKAPQRMAA